MTQTTDNTGRKFASENLPIAWRNVHDSLEGELPQKAFLWAAENLDPERRMAFRSEAYARQIVKMMEFGLIGDKPIMKMALSLHRKGVPHDDDDERVLTDLEKFILKRHAVDFWGRNVRMWFEFEPAKP